MLVVMLGRRLVLIAASTITSLFFATPLRAGNFVVQSSPNPNAHGNTLVAVSATSAADAWAVGFSNSNNLNDSRTLIEHWDGTSWKVVASPNPGTIASCQGLNTGNYLNAVSAITSSNAWAVGFYFSCTTLLKPLILHWNGTAWKTVPGPALRTNDNSSLNGIYALSANNIYAVGYQPAANGATLTLIEHWNGVTWSVVSSPNASATGNVLNAVVANSATDVWAAGDSVDQATTSVQTLVEHFNGTSWMVVPSPNPLPKRFLNQNVLTSIAALGPNNLSAVGYIANPATRTTLTLIERWNGASWNVVSSPNASMTTGSLNKLTGVAAVNASDIYAVGYLANAATGGQHKTLIEHFNGSSWSILPSPTPLVAQQLNGVYSLRSTTKVWVIGGSTPYGIDPESGLLQVPRTLVLFNPTG